MISVRMAPIGKSSLLRLAAYYVVLALAVVLLLTALPTAWELLTLEPNRVLSGAAEAIADRFGRVPPGGVEPGNGESLGQLWVALGAMAGVLLLMTPVVWVYIITKQREGYDQSVVQTMILLPITVAGVMIVVQSSRDSLALAFALAAIVAAVRFRNTLKDTKDTVYIFLAIGVGLAAGSHALLLAALMSVVFNLVVLVLWHFNVGNLYADQRGRTGRLKLADALTGPGGGQSLAVGDPTLLAALTPAELGEVADRSARLQEHIAARVRAKKKPYNALLLVHAAQLEPAQRSVEEVLDDRTKRWKLVEILPGEGGHSTLEYLVRMRKDVLPAALLDGLRGRGAPHVVAAEFKSLKGTTKES